MDHWDKDKEQEDANKGDCAEVARGILHYIHNHNENHNLERQALSLSLTLHSEVEGPIGFDLLGVLPVAYGQCKAYGMSNPLSVAQPGF